MVEEKKEIWDKLDEVLLGTIGAGMLSIMGYTAIVNNYNGGTAQICITGIVAIVTAALGLKAGQNKSGK